MNPQSILEMFAAFGFNTIVKKEEQKNGTWYRIKKDGEDITISLWMDKKGFYRFEFESWD